MHRPRDRPAEPGFGGAYIPQIYGAGDAAEVKSGKNL
jgi:hypothetical protein